MQDPMIMARAMPALQGQAAAWAASTNEALTTRGLGFSDEDRAAIAASASAHPVPEEGAPGTEVSAATVADMTRRAMEAVYPPEGFDPADPRIAPVEGVSLALLAIGAKAIGWSTDEAHERRVVAALGVDFDTWKRASAELRERVAGDIVLGAFYGQLFSAA